MLAPMRARADTSARRRRGAGARSVTNKATPASAAAAPVDAIARAAASDLPKAMKLALAAKSRGVAHPLVHHLVGLKLKGEGRFEEAVAELGLGLQLEPQNAALTTDAGLCLLAMRRRPAAAHAP